MDPFSLENVKQLLEDVECDCEFINEEVLRVNDVALFTSTTIEENRGIVVSFPVFSSPEEVGGLLIDFLNVFQYPDHVYIGESYFANGESVLFGEEAFQQYQIDLAGKILGQMDSKSEVDEWTRKISY